VPDDGRGLLAEMVAGMRDGTGQAAAAARRLAVL